jgi:hypothetical protein
VVGCYRHAQLAKGGGPKPRAAARKSPSRPSAQKSMK